MLGDRVRRHHSARADRIAADVHTADLPKTQKCEYCDEQATQRVIHSEGMAYIPCCDAHLEDAENDAAHCVPGDEPDPSNVDRVEKISACFTEDEMRAIARDGAEAHPELVREMGQALEAAGITRKAAIPDGYQVHLMNTSGYGGGIAGLYPKGIKPTGGNWHSAIAWDNQGKIDNIDTKPRHQGKGLARSLYDHVKSTWRPDLMHDRSLTSDGKAFSQAVGGQMFDNDEWERRYQQNQDEKKMPWEDRDKLWRSRGWPDITDVWTPNRQAAADQEYWMDHRAPTNDGYCAPMHALHQMIPDVHERPQDYHGGTVPENLSAIRRSKDSPDTKVKIYRAMPRQGRGGYAINPGDWVTTNREYAVLHGLGGEEDGRNMPVVQATVPAKHLYSDGNSLEEWGYDPGHETPKPAIVVTRPTRGL
ncbi:putative aminotransferase [Rhodococcus phage E3]|uniref:ParB C-terminal domain n=1 Tax=Rhodococcus phage E3 TaxID=1007869 RepID=UPI0002C69A8C|nr:ParB C-terminal domain [Rhodococcus phage E3]AEQ21126.1 putative aminotransferase [Rhodococcus phage E3]